MTKKLVGLRTLAGASAFVLTIVWTVQAQQPVETTQLTVKQPVAEDPLAEWEKAYNEAMEVAEQVARSSSIRDGRRLADDLEDVDEALREYVRVAERLRHKQRALFDTVEDLAIHNSVQSESGQFQTLANAIKVAHEVENNTTENMKK
jgi:hypothetical protein